MRQDKMLEIIHFILSTSIDAITRTNSKRCIDLQKGIFLRGVKNAPYSPRNSLRSNVLDYVTCNLCSFFNRVYNNNNNNNLIYIYREKYLKVDNFDCNDFNMLQDNTL